MSSAAELGVLHIWVGDISDSIEWAGEKKLLLSGVTRMQVVLLKTFDRDRRGR
jgi:hypothetical protein